MSIRVLVVEDETNIADFVLRGLREEGYVVEHAADGATAWNFLRSAEWDLVLLDRWLPDQDGLSLLQRFRQVGGHTPVLFLTARDAVSDRVRGLDAGADDYLTKLRRRSPDQAERLPLNRTSDDEPARSPAVLPRLAISDMPVSTLAASRLLLAMPHKTWMIRITDARTESGRLATRQ